MPQLDIYHNPLKNALIRDNWHVTDDPLRLKVGRRNLYIDLGAEYLLSAEKSGRKIAVEIKSFTGSSDVKDLEQAVGQYIVYQKILQKQQPERYLYLAVNEKTFNNIFSEEIGELLLADQTVRLIVFDEQKEVITRWIPD